ncbi:MAG: NAD-dependent DNA ligase LigA [Candidatus Absconditabacteria bacterium]
MDKERLLKLTDLYLKLINDENNPIDMHEKKLYDDIIEIINFHNYMYYVEANPMISDYQYDVIFDFLKKLEEKYPEIINENSPTQKLTFQIQQDFKKYNHRFPLGSLQNCYNAQDLIDWNDTIVKTLEKEGIEPKFTFAIEPKYDGSSVALVYKNGRFSKGVTRGDGLIGEDITENVRAVAVGVPLALKNKDAKGELIFRGEILMPKSSLVRINEEKVKNGEQIFANTRNSVAGTLRQLDPNVTKRRGLVCYVYDVLNLEERKELAQDNQLNLLDRMDSWGLSVFRWTKKADNIEEVIKICESKIIQDYLDGQNFEFDGLVIKINEKNICKLMGETAHHPKWAMAYKFPTKQVATQILSVEYSLGRSGTITPVANLEKVEMGGVQISRASLHNFDFIKEKDVRLGDYVWVQRSGEVIPYILGPILDRRTALVKHIEPPKECPICGGEVVKDDVFYRCANLDCPGIIKEKLTHFVSRNCMNIDGLGEKIIDLLVDSKLLLNVSDIYKLYQPQIRVNLSSLPGMGKKRVGELLQQIELSKKNPLRRIIHGLGIQEVGKKMAKEIEQGIYNYLDQEGRDSFNYESLIKLLKNKEFLLNIYGIGDKMIEMIVSFVSDKGNVNVLKHLSDMGVKFNNFDIDGKQLLLDGVRFCITGKFYMSRGAIIEVLEGFGASYDDNPTYETNFLLKGEGGGSKLSKAQDYMIEIIDGLSQLTIKYPFLSEYFKGSSSKEIHKAVSLF